MKYIELTGYGNRKSHLIPENAIANIQFEEEYTSINLINGHSINVVEDKLVINSLLEDLGARISNEELLSLQDELPF